MKYKNLFSKTFAVTLLVPALVAGAVGVDDVGGSATLRNVNTLSGAAAVTAGTYTFTGSEATMSPRFFRSGTPGGACSTFSSGNFQYAAVPFMTDGSGTLNATVDPQTCGTGVYVTFHVGAFNPASICSGYQWSFGSSQAFNENFTVPTNTAMTMVISGVANAPGVACGPVAYSLNGTGGGAVSGIPVDNPFALAALAGLMGVAVFRFRKSRQA